MKKVICKSLQLCLPIALLPAVFFLGYWCWNRYVCIVSMNDSAVKAREEIQKLSQGKPFPSKENLQKAIQKSKNYDIDYQLYTTAHQQFNLEFLRSKKSKNEVDFYFLLMAYINFLTNYAKESAVTIPDKTAFGFEPYSQKDVIPAQAHIDELYKQSKIIVKLLILLFDSNIHGMDLLSISRESVGNSSDKQKFDDSVGTLDRDQAIPNRKDTMKSYLFSIEFLCHTDAFRNYINKLQEYSLPVIVRSLAINSENKSSSENVISLTEKVSVSMVLEWLFIRDAKNVLKSEDKG
ncbi:MAG: Amuc_1100 family pilus-like protein [Puniceicoccales bacterium]|nr:Amuc_1100 family pilus-like protein [Puniceicoccales bacterium]